MHTYKELLSFMSTRYRNARKKACVYEVQKYETLEIHSDMVTDCKTSN